jgi:PKD repeat protein
MNVTVADSSCTPATAAFTSTPSELTVAFTDASTDPSAWSWDFGDGNTSTAQNPSYTYDSAGTYTVCLIVTNPCSADTSCTNITVTCATPVASFTSLSSDLTVTFSDASSNTTSWSWDFGDGNASNSQNPTYSYSAAGTYNVCLTANSGCATDVMCDSITVMAVGLEEPNVLAKMQVYPNPTDGMLNISIPASLEKDMTFTIYNILGEVVFETVASNLKYKTSNGVQKDYSIDLRYLANGSYLLRATSGDKLFTERVVFYK